MDESLKFPAIGRRNRVTTIKHGFGVNDSLPYRVKRNYALVPGARDANAKSAVRTV